MQLIETILGKKNNIKVIKHLTLHKDWQFNITELSKDINLNKGVLSRLIENLEKENIIKVNKKGKIKLFSINKENIIIKELIIPLFEKEKTLPIKLLQPLITKIKKETTSIILYGSYAKETYKLTSDIDLLIISNKTLNLDNFKEDFLKKDLLLRIDIISTSELKNIYKKREPFILSILKNNKTLYGTSLKEILE